MAESGNGDFDGPVRISNKDIYYMLIDVRDRVAALEFNIATVLKEHQDLRLRMRALELKFYGILAGVLGGLVIIVREVVT